MEYKNNRRVKIKWVDRKQFILRPTNVEELIPEDHPARAVWEFTGGLDLTPFYDRIVSEEGEAGRTAFDPRMMISLWLYAYGEGIGSAREVSEKCERDNAFQWLCGLMKVNYHSLSDFRIKYKEELDDLFTYVLGLLSAEGLITLKRVGQDGTKIRANAGSDTYRREERIKEHLEEARKQVKELEDPLMEPLPERRKQAKRRAARERKEKMELALKELEKIRSKKRREEEKRKARVSTTDPEARIMKEGDGGYNSNFNVQFATDEEAGAIVGVDVTQDAEDYDKAAPMMEQINERMGKYPDEYVVDGGFTSRAAILDAAKKGVDLIGPPLEESDARKEERFKSRGITEEFYTERFKYDEDNNVMICPAGKVLRPDGKEERRGVTYWIYRANEKDCAHCEHRLQCCPNNKSKRRTVIRKEEDPAVLDYNRRVETPEAKEVYKKRGSINEFTNACIKARCGFRQFHLRGLIKAYIEILWAALAHNIKRWISLRWLPALQAN